MAGVIHGIPLCDTNVGDTARQIAASDNACDFIWAVPEGRLQFRALGVACGNPIFQQNVVMPRLRLADIVTLGIAAAGNLRVASFRRRVE